MAAINCWRSAGTGGRPGARDFHRQKRRNPLRCHRISVSGFTIVSAALQSISRESTTRVIRVASSARRGLTRRSWYSASCFRRNRFSAASWDRDRRPSDTNLRASISKRTVVRHTIDEDERFRMRKHATTHGSGFVASRRGSELAPVLCRTEYLRSTREERQRLRRAGWTSLYSCTS